MGVYNVLHKTWGTQRENLANRNGCRNLWLFNFARMILWDWHSERGTVHVLTKPAVIHGEAL